MIEITEQPKQKLSEAKRALLARRLQTGAQPPKRGSITPRHQEQSLLSFAQERLWFLEQLEPNSPLYTMPAAFHLSGPLHTDVLEGALRQVVDRHHVLRTHFVKVDGGPRQVVAPSGQFKLDRVEFGGDEAELLARLSIEAARPFDLAKNLMLRATLFRLAPDGHVLLLNMHHIASDGWSWPIFLREVAEFYEAAVDGRAPNLPALPIQYSDFASWEREQANTPQFAEQLAYWRRHLAEVPPLLQLPSDQPRPEVQSFRGGAVMRLASSELRDGLNALARREGVTLFLILLAAFKVLLHRYTRREDLVVGVPVAGRNEVEIESLIGLFVNTLVVRTDLSGRPAFRDVLRRVKQVMLDAHANQDVPFERLVEELRPPRDPGFAPLVQVMFAFQSSPAPELKLADLQVRKIETTGATSKFDLTLFVENNEDSLRLGVEFCSDLFAPAMMARLLEHYENLLRAIAANPEAPISELPLLTAGERRTLLEDWNRTQADYPREKTLAQLFEEQVERAPTAIAVEKKDAWLTYRELNERANQLANQLRKVGVGRDTLVGVALDRSIEMVVALVAILKAGAAYLALDITDPKARIQFLLEDSKTRVFVTTAECWQKLGFSNGALHAVLLDQDASRIARAAKTNPAAAGSAGDLAYVSFTSGSTGRPKGVCVPQRAVGRLVINTDYLQLGAGDVVAQISNCAFDASTFEIWGALLTGAKLQIFPQSLVLSAKELQRELVRTRVTAMFVTTALFNQLTQEAPGLFGSVRCLLFGGDAANPRRVASVLRNHPPTRLLHVYGPTESTTFATWHEVRAVADRDSTVPIGRPIANTELFVLDEQLEPVPIGVPGELYIGGDGLARGYLNRPERTAEKFVPHPFRQEAGARLYRTGDIVRYREDGNLEFIGRADCQIKIRGFRVELAEVETVLAQHPGVSECVVSALGEPGGDKRLVAHVAIRESAGASAGELQKFLRTSLPDYMVPSAFVFMPSLPLNANGKVNRAALPTSDISSAPSERNYVAPRDAVEAELAKIWEELLPVKPIGVLDNFFTAGGHSLLAIRLLALVEQRMGRTLPPVKLFQSPTLGEFADVIRSAGPATPAGTALVPIQPEGTKPPLFLVHGAGGGMQWGYANLARHLGEDQPVYSFKARCADKREGATIAEMASRYVSDLRQFQPHGPYYLGGYCFGGNVAQEMARQLQAQGETVALLVLMNSLPTGPRYHEVKFSLDWARKFAANIGYLVRWHFGRTPPQRRRFIAWQLRTLCGRVRRWFGAQVRPLDAGEFVDLSAYSAEERPMWDAHVQALFRHDTQPYVGRTVLLRSRGHQFWCSFDAAYGWGDFLKGPFEIHSVAGAHEQILEEPFVQSLAEELKKNLQAARNHPAGEAPEARQPKFAAPLNDREGEPLPPQAYAQAFEAQVNQSPTAVAVSFKGQELTYAELNRHANQLAHHLRALGVGPEVLVAVSLERTPELLVALLAVLKSGGAYVPLDPTYPKDRLQFMLSDSRARVLLTQSSFVETFAAAGTQIVCLDDAEQQAQIRRCPETDPAALATGDNLAYVIYTSGSTGTPKGVQITHRSLLNHNFAVRELYQLQATDRVLQFSPFSFDISVEEIFPSWLAGSAVVLRTADALTSAAHFLAFARVDRLTVLNLPTAYWHEVVEALDQTALPDGVRLVIIGGERAAEASYRRWKERVKPHVGLINTYGPTEATVIVTAYRASAADDGTLPIGKPIANAQVLILDSSLRPVPDGETGELCISGCCLARGYLNRPELTAEKFVPNPVPGGPGFERLYRTGDLARYRGDGNIEFIGREDQQVKIRGFRVELCELENVLREHPDVKDVVVMAREDTPGNKRLVAYFVARRPLPQPKLREYAKSKLPPQMLPAAFVALDALPLSPNGKVDRKALPAPQSDRPELGESFTAPRTPLETVLAKIWAEVLEVGTVGINDNFFDLGGHSLLAAQILSRIRNNLHLEVSLSTLFSNPTVARLAEHLTDASSVVKPVLPLADVPDGKRLPLTPTQQRLWFFDVFEPEQSSYNIPVGIRLSGRLDVAALEKSLTELARRHEALRAVFPVENGVPIQYISDAQSVPLPTRDLRELPREARWERASTLICQEARNSYVLAHPMMRALLIQLEDESHILLLILHQLAADNRSLRILLQELPTLYGAFATGKESPLPPLQLPYGEVVLNGHLTPEEEKAQFSYWLKQLEGAPTVLDLPSDRPRPPHKTDAGARWPVVLPESLVAKLEKLGARENTNLFATLLAGFQAVLFRYTGSTDFLVASPAPKPHFKDAADMIGQFENLLLLRANLAGEPTFRDLLQRTTKVVAGAWKNRALPFEKLLDALKPERNPRDNPVFQVFYQFEEQPLPTGAAAEVSFDPFEIDNKTSKLALSLSLTRTASGVYGWIEYSTALFDADRMARLAEHLQVLLAEAAAAPEERVVKLPLLPAKEKNQLLLEWNQTSLDYPRTAALVELFEAQVGRTPDATALVDRAERISYRELNAWANKIAHHLRTLGVGPEVLVGVCVERSWRMIAGILGILKAGGAYVPMDPAYPKERLEFMLADAKAPVLLTQQKWLGRFEQTDATSRQRSVVCLDSDWSKIEHASDENLSSKPAAENLAYVIYTSGSTGKPKGVAIEHRAPVALLHWARDVFPPEEIAGVLGATSICFDLSIFEMFVPLSWGGTLILAENALALATLPAAKEVTLVNTVPSAMRELLRVKGIPASVRVVNLAGEPLTTALADQIYDETSVKKVYDLYGPSETTTYSTGALRQRGEPPTIGRPLANEQVYLLDARREPVPIGVPGELYIGGDGLARGYLHRLELTAERFVANPFRSGERLYRTGDLARWRADGNIEFLGRMDHQIKIRGFRVELGELEAAVRKHADIAEAVAVAYEHPNGDKRLALYLVPRPGRKPALAEVRSFLLAHLPEHMVPSDFVFLAALPLTPNGKVDRKALPPVKHARRADSQFVPPITAVEKSVAAIWREVLGLESVSLHDNFFELGGHSLLAIQVVSRIRTEFHAEVPLFVLFDTPTVAALAKGLESGEWTGKQAAVLPLQPAPRNRPLPASFVQERLWFLHALEPDSDAYNVPFAIRLRGRLDRQVLEKAFHSVVQRHETLRTAFTTTEGNLAQVIEAAVELPIEFVSFENEPAPARESRARAVLDADARRPFDLARAPLLRVTLAKLDDAEHLLGIVMHHSISDGWSLTLLFAELEKIYNALVSGRASAELPKLPIQYADYACWQREVISGAALENEMAWWRKTLAGAEPAIRLPRDTANPLQEREVGRATCQYSSEFSNAMNAFCQKQGGTPFMAFASALAITLQKWAQQNDLVLGTVVAGRTRRELENIIGCFMNFLPLRINLTGHESGAEIVAKTRTAILDAQNHQDCPFEKIVEAVNPKRRADANPLYNVGLLMQNFPEQTFKADGLATDRVAVGTSAALLDLRFEVEEAANNYSLICEYRTGLFSPETIEQLLASLERVLDTLVRQPETRLTEFQLAPELDAQAKAARHAAEPETIAVTATFTADFLNEPLRYWMNELKIPAEIEFAPYGQVFQQLLDGVSLLGQNRRGLNIVLVRLEDWQSSEADRNGDIAQKANELVAAVKSAAGRSAVPLVVSFCPSARIVQREPERAGFFENLEDRVAAELQPVGGVTVITSAELLEHYPVPDHYDPQGDELGHVPYTPAFFAALATMLARRFHALKRPPCKVIALDCDHTLWSGVCGEDGPTGIMIDPPRRALQEFMRRQLDAGRLLCLCSKNNEEDVLAVFKQREDLPLRPDHFVARQVNWNPKSANLRALAAELNVGLDSFVFVDDNPVECAEVSSGCPEVVALKLPEDPQQIPQFLKHCWVFDHHTATAEDSRRTELYQQNRKREALRRESSSFADFVASLELQIQIRELAYDELARASQLTQRTNQFNANPCPRTEADLRQLTQQPGCKVRTIHVSDRFGEYGLVGAIFVKELDQALRVDGFLLSCRVLGKGVEHQMVQHLGRMARQSGKSLVQIKFTPSPKNRPAREFLEKIAGQYRQALNGGFVFALPVEVAETITFQPVEDASSRAEANSPAVPTAPSLNGSRFDRWQWIAENANDPEKILQAITAQTPVRTRQSTGGEPVSELEQKLCALWQELLHVDRVGVNDDFFELGGHSVLAVRMFVRIEALTGKHLPIVTIFQAPTIAQLAQRIVLMDQPNASRIVPIQPKGKRLPLFLIHGAGGDAMWGYANIAQHFGLDQPVYGVQTTGPEEADKFDTLEAMAAEYISEILALQPKGPYCLGGYCFGGNLAYEMARQLDEMGHRVAFLALLETTPERGDYEKVYWWRPSFPVQFLRNLRYCFDDFYGYSPAERRSLLRRKLKVWGGKILRKLNGEDSRADVDLDDIIDSSKFNEQEIRLWDAHIRLLTRHASKPYRGHLWVFRTAAHPLFCSYQPDLGWGKLVEGGVTVTLISGSHGNIFLEPNARDLAGKLESAMAEISAGQSQSVKQLA